MADAQENIEQEIDLEALAKADNQVVDEKAQDDVIELTDFEQYDPISGFPTFKSLLCEVSVADNNERKEINNSEKSGDKVGYVRFRLLRIPCFCKTRRTVCGFRSTSSPMRLESS